MKVDEATGNDGYISAKDILTFLKDKEQPEFYDSFVESVNRGE